MAGYRETFGANVDYAYQRGTRDIARHLESGIASLRGGQGVIAQYVQSQQQARRGLDDMIVRAGQLKEALDDAADPVEFERLSAALSKTTRGAEKFAGQLRQMKFDMMERGLGKLTKGLISLNTSILTIGFDFLIESIKRVYELQERWTKAIGGFNLRIGGMTSGLKQMTQQATRTSGVIRGLTDGDISEGIQMFADFADAMGSTTDNITKFGNQMVYLGRGFNLGGQGAGKLYKTFSALGDSADDVTDIIGGTLVRSADRAHISTNMLAKDISESTTYMARFGKTGQKTFVEGAAYVRKFGISMEEVRRSVEGLDMFDEAAKTAAKLNTAFGTMINSMDLMLEDDPAKRLEMIRQQFLAQGTTYEKLSPKQRRYLSETLKLNEEQTAALLSQANAGQSYADFQAKAAKREKQDLDAKRAMEIQLRATAQTMFAFGVAFDRITVAIANAIKPILRVIGLAGEGNKKFGSFGEVMESITKTVERFFNSLAENPKWNDFMEELAHDLQDAGTALKKFVMDGRAAELVGDIARGMKEFYVTVRDLVLRALPMLHPLLDVFLALSRHIKEIAAGWAVMKGINFASQFTGGGAGGAVKGLVGAMGTRMGGAAVGAATGAAISGGGIGGTVGGGLGGAIGSAWGPIGNIAGTLIGTYIGEGLEKWLSGSKGQTELERIHSELDEQIKKETAERDNLNGLLDVASKRQEAEDRVRKSRNDILRSMDEAASKAKNNEITLVQSDVEALRERANELSMFGKSAKANKELLDKLGVGTKLTKAQLDNLIAGASAYEDELGKLRSVTQQQADAEMARLQMGRVGQQKEAGEALQRLREQELKALRGQLLAETGVDQEKGQSLLDRATKQGWFGTRKKTFGSLDEMQSALQANLERNKGALGRTNDPQQKKIIQGQIEQINKQLEQVAIEQKINKLDMENSKSQKDLLRTQTDFMRQQTIITLKQFAMGSSAFLDFMKSDSEKGKGPEQAFRDYLSSPAGSSDIIAGFGQAGYDLLREGPNVTGIKASTAPREESSFSSPMTSKSDASVNFAAPQPGANRSEAAPTFQLNQTIVLPDGTPVQRSSSRHALTSRGN